MIMMIMMTATVMMMMMIMITTTDDDSDVTNVNQKRNLVVVEFDCTAKFNFDF